MNVIKKTLDTIVEYCNFVFNLLKNEKIKSWIYTILLVVTALFINLFTNLDSVGKFQSIESTLNFYQQAVFYYGFAMVAIMCLIKAGIGLFFVFFASSLAGFLLWIIHKIYTKFIKWIVKKANFFLLIMIIFLEAGLGLYFAFRGLESGVQWWTVLTFLLILLAVFTFKELNEEVERYQKT